MIGIGILTYFELHEAIRLIKSIEASGSAHEFAICVRDNTDSGPGFDRVLSEHPDICSRVAVLRDGTNIGCSAARNQSWRYFQKTHADMEYMIILDQDVTVGPGWIEDMLEVATAHPDAGQVVWPIFNMAKDTPTAEGCIHDAASGASLYRMLAVQATNGWDERFFFYRFDTWFTLLSYARGWRTYLVMKYGEPGENWAQWIKNHTENGVVFCGPMKHHHPHRGVKRHPDVVAIRARSLALFNQLLREHKLKDFYEHWPQVEPGRCRVTPGVTRVGVWYENTKQDTDETRYVWQYCHAMASLGLEVVLHTNRVPTCFRDLPEITGGGQIRIDLETDGREQRFDVIVTDARGTQGRQAAAWKRLYPKTPMFTIVFETMSWVKSHLPGLVRKEAVNRDIILMGDYCITPSQVGQKHLMAWLEATDPSTFFVLPPSVNTFAVARASAKAFAYSRPYAVWAGDTSAYRGGAEAINAVMRLRMPLDLVLVGWWDRIPMINTRHRILVKPNMKDLDRYSVMRGARAILAPALFDGCGVLVREAAALGVPFLGYDLPILRESAADWPGLRLVRHGRTAQFFEELQRMILTRAPASKPDPRWTLDTLKRRVAALPLHG